MQTEWEPLDLSALTQRLRELTSLIAQAAAVGAAQDLARAASLQELAEKQEEGQRVGRAGRRR